MLCECGYDVYVLVSVCVGGRSVCVNIKVFTVCLNDVECICGVEGCMCVYVNK